MVYFYPHLLFIQFIRKIAATLGRIKPGVFRVQTALLILPALAACGGVEILNCGYTGPRQLQFVTYHRLQVPGFTLRPSSLPHLTLPCGGEKAHSQRLSHQRASIHIKLKSSWLRSFAFLLQNMCFHHHLPVAVTAGFHLCSSIPSFSKSGLCIFWCSRSVPGRQTV